ncbi:MAG: helix-turn-helix domain-containing protein [Actinomycetota bacterium]
MSDEYAGGDPAQPGPRESLGIDALRWIEHVAVLELYTDRLPRRTGQVATALVFLDRDLPMSSRDIAAFARTGHETVRRSADALEAEGLIDRHRRPIYHARSPH